MPVLIVVFQNANFLSCVYLLHITANVGQKKQKK